MYSCEISTNVVLIVSVVSTASFTTSGTVISDACDVPELRLAFDDDCVL